MSVVSSLVSDPASAAEHLRTHLIQLEADLGADHLGAGEDGQILQHGLAPVTKAGALTATAVNVPRIL